MAITDLKLKDSDIAAKGVVAAPTVLAGSPEENKKIFDRLIREVFQGDFNSLIDALTASTGAGEIGASVDGLTGGTVQALLTALKAYVDDWESETITSTVGAAQAAADSAAAAAAAAESISQHPPRVSSSNTWEIWDEDSGAYVDSGKPAKGDDGLHGTDLHATISAVDATTAHPAGGTLVEIDETRYTGAGAAITKNKYFYVWNGEKGGDGVSPKITSIEKGQSTTSGFTKINFTDADGAHSITINDGKDGSRGTHGDSVTVTGTAADATDEHPNGGVNLVFTLTRYNASGAPPTTLEMPFTIWNGNDGGTGDGAVSSVNGETGDVKTSFTVKASVEAGGTVTVDKTPGEIYVAYAAGMNVCCEVAGYGTAAVVCGLSGCESSDDGAVSVGFAGLVSTIKHLVLSGTTSSSGTTAWSCTTMPVFAAYNKESGVTGYVYTDIDGRLYAKSAYDSAKAGGYTGTEGAFNAALAAVEQKAAKSRAVTATLRAANWNAAAKSVTAQCSGVTASSNIVVTPSAGSYEAYCQAGVRCTSATTNTLAFKCSTVPTVNLTVNVLILG